MSNLQFTENAAGLGVVVHAVNLAVGLAAHHTLQIRHLMQRYRLVIFREQQLTDAQLLAFALRFGPVFAAEQRFPVLGSEEQQAAGVVVIGNRADEFEHAFLGNQEVLPHTDHQWLRCPSAASLLHAWDIGEASAPTVWTDMAHAYATLDQETRDLIEGLRLITYNPFFRPFGTIRYGYVDRRVEIPPGDAFAHPLVRTHPETREKMLYLNAAYELELVGVPPEIGAPLMTKLLQHTQTHARHYEHQWQNGDLVLWDNRATMHYRPPFDASVRRVLKRVTLGGGVPF